MDTSDKRDDENWLAYWQRKHDERHGPTCDTPGCIFRFGVPAQPGLQTLLPESLRLPEQVPEGKRLLGSGPSRASARKSTANSQDDADPDREWWEE